MGKMFFERALHPKPKFSHSRMIERKTFSDPFYLATANHFLACTANEGESKEKMTGNCARKKEYHDPYHASYADYIKNTLKDTRPMKWIEYFLTVYVLGYN